MRSHPMPVSIHPPGLRVFMNTMFQISSQSSYVDWGSVYSLRDPHTPTV